MKVYIYVGVAKCEKGISDNLSRMPRTNEVRTVSTLKGLRIKEFLKQYRYKLEEVAGDLAVLTLLCSLP